MRIAVMQPYLFPYIGYFHLIKAADKFIVFDDVNYINKGWINRNRILVNNSAHLFTIPLIGASQNKLINEIELESGEKWKVKLLRTIEMSYAKAPQFNEVFPVIKEIIQFPALNLAAYVTNSLKVLASFASINTLIVPTSSVYNNQQLKGEDRILDICQHEHANEYVNPIGGTELYSKERFEQKDIKLFFVKTGEISYTQMGKEFVPWLSIIDVLMFCDKQQVSELLAKYELV